MYQFNTNVAKHYFCKKCGIYTHHQRRSNPNEFAINVGCIDDLDPNKYFKLDVVNNDGNKSCGEKYKMPPMAILKQPAVTTHTLAANLAPIGSPAPRQLLSLAEPATLIPIGNMKHVAFSD